MGLGRRSALEDLGFGLAVASCGSLSARGSASAVKIAISIKAMFGPTRPTSHAPASSARIGPERWIAWLIPMRVPALLRLVTA